MPGSADRRLPSRHLTPTPRGCCPWCKRPSPRGRARWHRECVAEHHAEHPGHQRQAVQARDHGVCASCTTTPAERQADLRAGLIGRQDVAWQADHIVPLADGGLNNLANLQTLCAPCHRGKTAAEATARAARAKETTACASPS